MPWFVLELKRAVVMTIDEAVAIFEKGRPVKEGSPYALSQTGEEYIMVVSGARHVEGNAASNYSWYYKTGTGRKGKSEFRPTYDTEDEAVAAWLEHALKLKVKSGTIYWRKRPEMTISKAYRKKVYSVYSRFLISDKPVIHREAVTS